MRFTIDAAILAAKTAYLCSLLLMDDMSKITRFRSPEEITTLEISPYYSNLNKFKKTSPEDTFIGIWRELGYIKLLIY